VTTQVCSPQLNPIGSGAGYRHDQDTVFIARQQEEAAAWRRLSQELYLECDRLCAEAAAQKRQFEKEMGELQGHLNHAVAVVAQLQGTVATTQERLAFREAQHAKVRRSFIFTFYSLRFTVKQVIKLILLRLRLRRAPDPTDYLAGDA
jgi:hypothetical protein